MRILIIDDSLDFCALLRLYLSKEMEDAEIDDYEFEKLGRPPENYDWARYDVLMLDYKLGETEDGLEWLKTFGQKPGFPPTVILTAEGDEYVAIKAVKLGAADYINKKDISPKRLKSIVEEAADLSAEKERERREALSEASQIIQSIKQNREGSVSNVEDIGYKFVRLIGQGGMSLVYLAERVSDKASLVLKTIDLIKVEDGVLIQRFIQEAKLIAKLNSPFVVKIHEYGLTEEYGYIAMEFFSRGDLKQRMELKLTPDVAFNYMTHIAYGLDAIHSIGVVHRDLKPGNVMFRGDDSLALADFGISKKIDEDIGLTTVGQVIGTPHYLSPEQGEGRPVDGRSDLYSAGVMLYELLVNKKPFTAQTPAALIYQHVHADIPELPKELSQYQWIINKALAKNVEERFQTAREFIGVMEAAERDFY